MQWPVDPLMKGGLPTHDTALLSDRVFPGPKVPVWSCLILNLVLYDRFVICVYGLDMHTTGGQGVFRVSKACGWLSDRVIAELIIHGALSRMCSCTKSRLMAFYYGPLASCTQCHILSRSRLPCSLCLTTQTASFIHIKQCVYLHAWLWLLLRQLIQCLCYVQVHLKRYGEQLSNSVAFPHRPQMQ